VGGGCGRGWVVWGGRGVRCEGWEGWEGCEVCEV
jgi:hypothetical protein